MRKGIILAGGYGTRLYPLTKTISKQLLPVYNKPMIYYPLSTLIDIGIKDILIITTPKDRQLFENLLEDGSQWGVHLQYATQQEPRGLAQAFLIGEKFIGKDDVVMILGDNIFYGAGLDNIFEDLMRHTTMPTIFGYYVKDPKAYGVAVFDSDEYRVTNVEEKPEHPKSNYAIPGLYFFPNDVIQKARNISPSKRNELEITSIMEKYIKEKKLYIYTLDNIMWFDAGTFDALIEASSFVQTVEKRLGIPICDPRRAAAAKGWIESE